MFNYQFINKTGIVHNFEIDQNKRLDEQFLNIYKVISNDEKYLYKIEILGLSEEKSNQLKRMTKLVIKNKGLMICVNLWKNKLFIYDIHYCFRNEIIN